ncbi:MAG: hypothetical protein JXA51_05200 [Dehalococcoidales bacterium]|nr:hypothetical protein [Dehalococcoidales bacterium]
MPKGNYDRYFTTEIVKDHPEGGGAHITSTRHLKDFGGGQLSIDCIYITSPHRMISQPHKHDFAQYLSFFSANPDDAKDFDAEIEMCLGKEQEKHIITRPTSVYVPAGLDHGPVNFAKINKPVLFLDIAVTGEYTRVGNTPD